MRESVFFFLGVCVDEGGGDGHPRGCEHLAPGLQAAPAIAARGLGPRQVLRVGTAEAAWGIRQSVFGNGPCGCHARGVRSGEH